MLVGYDTLAPVRVELAGPRVHRLTPLSTEQIADLGDRAARLPWVSPGFVDVQVNGWNGQEFSSLELTPERVAKVTREHYPFGVTGYCPTLTTQSYACLAHGLGAIHRACEEIPEVARHVVGIHLEGPFFSKEDGPRGAHPKEHCQDPDFDAFRRLQDAAGGRIRILTMSCEFPNSAEFIAQVSETGVCVAIGHTGADGSQIRAAVDAGANSARISATARIACCGVTRTTSGTNSPRIDSRRASSSTAHHLPGEVVKSMVRAKTPERVVLVSDVSGLAGLPVGRYTTSGCELEILPDGRLVIAGQDQLLAGASLPIGFGIANVMRFAGVDLKEEAVTMASTRPARLIDAPHGGLRPGDWADLALFHLDGDISCGSHSLRVQATIARGEVIFGSVA